MPKFVLWIGILFLFVGLVMLGGGIWSENSSRDFDATAIAAEGTVIDLVRRRSDDGYVFAPVVEWRDANGTRQEFVGGVASSPPAYDVGEPIALAYPPGQPGKARVRDFTNRWFETLIFAGLGSVFTLAGGGIAYIFVRHRRRIAHLKERGMPIEAKFLETYPDRQITVNGRHPYRVAAQCVHPATGKLTQFRSEPIWVDPTDQLSGKPVRVLVDPANPKIHFMDLSHCVDTDDMV